MADGDKEAAEKRAIPRERSEKHTSGPKGPNDFGLVTAREKSCPFKTATFSASCNAEGRVAGLKFALMVLRLRLSRN